MNVVIIRGKSQFRLLFGSDLKVAAASKGIIGGLRTADQQNGWEFGELLGFRASVVASRYISGLEVVLHGDYDGKVYKQEEGGSLNGDTMTTVYTTPYLDFGDTETRKTFRSSKTFLDGEEDTTISMSLNYDWGDPTVTSPSAYILDLDTGVPIYDDSTYMYDDPGTIYGGNLTPVINKNAEGSFFSVSITYSTSSTDAPHAIHAIVIEYSVEGKR